MSGESGAIVDAVRRKLQEGLGATHVDVQDESGGCGAMVKAIVVSDKFDGVRLLDRHRMVHDLLKEEMKTIHALTLKTWTRAQYERHLAK